MKISVFLFSALLWVGAAWAEPELKGSPDELRQFLHPVENVVTLFAEAEEKAYSDTAIVSLVITTEDKGLSDSLAANSALRQRITAQLVADGIAAESIKSSTFSTSPQYGWFGKKASSYKVVNRMAITITDEGQLRDIAAVADAGEQVELSDTAFEHSRKNALEDRVRQQALARVMQQKRFYESSLGVELKPVGFRNAGQARQATRGAMMLEEIVVTAAKRGGGYSSNADADYPAKSSFDEVEYKAGIYVDFKIVDAPR